MHASQFSCSIGETMMASRMSKSPFSTWLFPMSTSHRVFPEPAGPNTRRLFGWLRMPLVRITVLPILSPATTLTAWRPPTPRHAPLSTTRSAWVPRGERRAGCHDCRPYRLAGGVVLRRHTSFHADLGRFTTQVIDTVAYPVSWAFRWTQRAGVNHTRPWTPPGLEDSSRRANLMASLRVVDLSGLVGARTDAGTSSLGWAGSRSGGSRPRREGNPRVALATRPYHGVRRRPLPKWGLTDEQGRFEPWGLPSQLLHADKADHRPNSRRHLPLRSRNRCARHICHAALGPCASAWHYPLGVSRCDSYKILACLGNSPGRAESLGCGVDTVNRRVRRRAWS